MADEKLSSMLTAFGSFCPAAAIGKTIRKNM
jgi:hypothetical protein